MRQRRLVSVLFGSALILIAFSANARCEESGAEVPQPRWGTTDRIFTHIGFTEFVNLLASDPPPSYYDSSTDTLGIYSTIPDGLFVAMAHVPSGALLTYLELDYCDTNTNPNVDVALYLRRCNYLGTGCTQLASLSSKDRQAGCHLATYDLTSLAVTMDNNLYELILEGSTQAGDSSTRLMGAYIGYKLQISPAPATPTFADVPASHPYFRAIEALAASGITGGCGNGNFCPDKNVTRGEIAVFLARALGLHFPN
ncbi:MAG TPA: S-layer homology domain-containing protein [Thermoanaerobaculia bacterium]|nr:S-layer homology domain-containing protein [Thermoanaerobaculia bacterium]